jgi:hypothetical protein
MLHPDGTLHFSDLKAFAKSPAHYRESILTPRTTTLPMRMGSLVDMLLLTPEREPIVYPGERRGNAWLAFAERHAGRDVYTTAEYERAVEVVHVVRDKRFVREYLGICDPERRAQVPLRWQTQGVPRSTRGVDVLTRGMLVDLKFTASAQPSILGWHMQRMHWHAQLADYADACAQNGISLPGGVFLLAIESSAPYATTAVRMTESALAAGAKCISAWVEQYKSCAAAGVWPDYLACPYELEIDDGGGGLVFPDETEDAA